jgi:hypothetical protein
MKQVFSITHNRVLLFMIVAAILINGVAAYFEYALISNITKITSIIILLTFYYLVRQRMANVFLTIFLFSLLGDTFNVFNLGDLSDKLSTTFYIGSYSLIIFVLLGKLNRIKYEGLVSIYLIVVLLLNSYFLYILYGVVKDNFSDDVNLTLSVLHGIALIAMTFFAFAVYLSQETTQSIIFLVMVFCFVFSDVLSYICNLYVYFWMFEFIANMLHLISLVLLYTYVYNHHKIIKVKRKNAKNKFAISKPKRLTV